MIATALLFALAHCVHAEGLAQIDLSGLKGEQADNVRATVTLFQLDAEERKTLPDGRLGWLIRLIQIAIGSQDQVQSAGHYYEQPLAAHVLDISGRPVQGAAVTFRVREGDATLDSNGTAGSALVHSDRAGTARVTARAPEHGQELNRRYLTDEAGFRKRAYVSQVEVTAPSARGELRSGRDLRLLMVAGQLHELRIEPAPERISTIWVPLVINGGLLGAFNGWTVVMP